MYAVCAVGGSNDFVLWNALFNLQRQHQARLHAAMEESHYSRHDSNRIV